MKLSNERRHKFALENIDTLNLQRNLKMLHYSYQISTSLKTILPKTVEDS